MIPFCHMLYFKRTRNATKDEQMERVIDSIQKAIDYIEDNLKNDLSNRQIASAIGYSEFHFLRMFREYVNLTPANYIRKRRISEIVRRMSSDERPISDIAFEYGFNSKENFIRAFKAEHHILPTEFKRYKNSLKLYGKLNLIPQDGEVTCSIVELDPFTLIAYPSDEEYAPNFWNKYNVRGCSKKLSGGAVVIDYGVSLWNHEKDRLDYWIGIKETDAQGNRDGTVKLHVKGGLYAMFQTPPSTHFEFVNCIHRTWDYAKNVWLGESGYVRRSDFEFECYLEESRLFSETIYIPIKKKEDKETKNEKTERDI